MPTSFSHIVLCLFTLPLLLLQLLQNCYYDFCHCYRYFHTTLLLNTLLQILSYPGVFELTTQLLILENILCLPLCRINKFRLVLLLCTLQALLLGFSLLVIIDQRAHEGITHARWWASWNWRWRKVDDDGDRFPSPKPKQTPDQPSRGRTGGCGSSVS